MVNLGVNTTNHKVQNQHEHCAAPYKESQEWMLQGDTKFNPGIFVSLGSWDWYNKPASPLGDKEHPKLVSALNYPLEEVFSVHTGYRLARETKQTGLPKTKLAFEYTHSICYCQI